MSFLKIIEPGFLTTVQDGGRPGYRGYGMPLSGAMDYFSHITGNLIVGNEPAQSSLEITLIGPVIEFSGSALIAVTGAETDTMINGKPIEMWCSVKVKRNDRLSFGSFDTGARVYLAVSGGLDVPLVMGSASTYLRGKIGGYGGRRLMAGDKISLNKSHLLFRKRRKLPLGMIPEWRKDVCLRVMHGLDFKTFSDEDTGLFFSSLYQVSNNSDRMGIRLSGPGLGVGSKADVISYPLAAGTIQVPGDGQPVIMLADSQTVGGYRQIGYIATADIWKTGQLKPGDRVNFTVIGYDDAVSALRELKREISQAF
jgi:antagonist of KipI